jgi:hypothetical protein
MLRGAVVILLAAVAVSGASEPGETLCPPPPPLRPEVDDLRMREGDFTAERYTDALKYLQSEVPKRLLDASDAADVINGSAFWISYANSLRVIEGYVLRREALHSILRGDDGPQLERFCRFLSEAEYTD